MTRQSEDTAVAGPAAWRDGQRTLLDSAHDAFDRRRRKSGGCTAEVGTVPCRLQCASENMLTTQRPCSKIAITIIVVTAVGHEWAN
jgi:hypothetical protein